MAEQGKPQSSKSKKSKRRQHAAGGPVVAAREDTRKRKEERSALRSRTETATSKGEDADGEEGIAGGMQENRNAARSKDRGSTSKRVSFADSAEVFRTRTEGGDGEGGGGTGESRLVHGRRFTPEEDATLMEAITSYTEMKQLGERGLEMIRSPRQHPELRRCWEVIGKSLPHRPYTAIYRRARILLNRSDVRKWTQDEKDHIRRFVEKNGTEWKKLAHELGKCDIHVKDTWRRIKLENLKNANHKYLANQENRFVEKNGTEWKTLAHELGKCDIHVKDTWRRMKVKNLKKGCWTQDEHQKLFDLVNIDLCLKAHQIKNPDHRKLRDNISWEAISEKLTTRNHKNCCLKWYDTLASPLVKKGIWADIDDYLLVEALQKNDAVCIEDVDWDSLLDHRSGEVCRQRWNQMVRGIGGHREKPFIQQVEVLSRRYCPEMIEYRK